MLLLHIFYVQHVLIITLFITLGTWATQSIMCPAKPLNHHPTPKLRADRLSKIFSCLRDQLKTQGLMNEVFSFVDASSLISKAQLWEERDKAVK